MSSRQYGLDRINKQGELTTAEMEKRLIKYYRASAARVIQEYEALYNKVLNEIANGEGVSPSHIYRLDRYIQVQFQLKEELAKLGETEIDLLTNGLSREYATVYNSIPMGQFMKITPEQAKTAVNVAGVEDGLNFSQRVGNNMDLLRQTLDEELTHCVITGKNTHQLKQLLVNRFNVSWSRANTLIRTETAHIQTQAAVDRYAQAGVEHVKFITAPGCCEECEEMDGKILTLQEALAECPKHPNCRCTFVPIIEE